jgi:molecular chaperone GrpE (heat shock protein)
MSDELLQHKIDLLQEQIDNLERSGFFTEKEMDNASRSLRVELETYKLSKAFSDFKKALTSANESFSTMQHKANNLTVNDPQYLK